ncbi:response regulator [Marinagarivorans algicola]|uniref:response regulator n=1 Tax=Marinagarivorans algicola TaxID=1513270 RepID=UPI000ACDBAC0|nr:response regulator [Marinagarivorans algicola]
MKHIDANIFSSVLARILEEVETLRGSHFINKITPLLAEVINADYTLVGRVNADGTEALTLCLCEGTQIIDNCSYVLNGTPCQQVADDRICFYPDDVCAAFPDDKLLIDLGIKGYLGAPLHGPDGNVMGLLIALFKTPVDDSAGIITLFKVFGGRIAAEITSREAQVALELELQKSQKLQEQYQLLARQERDARHRAQKANNVKSAFVANMSHEVKTPMNAMLAFCQMLLKSELNQSQRLQVQSMLDAGQQLMTMLNDVLELSRLEDGIIELPENQLSSHELFDGVVEQAISQVQQKPISLTYRINAAVPARMIAAEYHVQKVMTNLLSNAIKFTSSGEIHVDVDYELVEAAASETEVGTQEGRLEEGTLVVAVVDTGIGIAPKFLSEIFEPFTQQNISNTRVHGGTGLGLHLAHRLMVTMGGAIEVKSVQGQGSAFTLHLPIRVPNESPRAVNLPAPLAVLRLSALKSTTTEKESVSDNITQNCLAFLGVTVIEFNAHIPLALQLAQNPVAGVVLDSSSDGVDVHELKMWAQDVASEGLSCAVVISKDLAVNPVCASALAGVLCMRAPVLMHEWLKIIDVLQPCEHSAPTRAKPAATGERILLVEDNRLNQEIALCILEDAGYQVDVANNGQEAVDTMMAQRDAYQMILMDIQMPVMDGLEATRIIRKQLECRIPIVAVTAGIAVQDRQLCDAAGMDDFIPKPIDEDFVLQKVRYYTTGANLAQ